MFRRKQIIHLCIYLFRKYHILSGHTLKKFPVITCRIIIRLIVHLIIFVYPAVQITNCKTLYNPGYSLNKLIHGDVLL